MWSFGESKDTEWRRTALSLTFGAAGGLAIGLLLSRRGGRRVAQGIDGLGDRAGAATRGYSSAAPTEDPQLAATEDAVLDAFLNHPVLRERGIDVGAISRGIIELSGSVRTDDEADTAVHVANGVPGVQTVVNRLEIEEEARHLDETRERFENGDPALTETRWEGRRVGMGRMRQGRQTEPDRPDDSQSQTEKALRDADVAEWEDAGVHEHTKMAARSEDRIVGQEPDFDHDELDNQDPHRRHHAAETLDAQPQELNGDARVGEGAKPGTELRLEDADVPLEPQSDVGEKRG